MDLFSDVRFGFRTLRRSPGFALTAIVTLALGAGATTAVYSVADGMLWKPVPLPRIDRLAMLVQLDPDDPRDYWSITPADLADIRDQSASFQDIATWDYQEANIVDAGGEPERVVQVRVSANFFDLLGVPPARGRGFLPGDDQPGQERKVVLGDSLWRRRFAADPDIVGKTIRLDDRNFVVTGVMPPRFDFPKTVQLWTPLALQPDERNSRTSDLLRPVCLLAPRVPVDQARAEIQGIGARLAARYPATNKNRRLTVVSLHRYLIGEYSYQYVLMLFGAVLFVLLIACVNVANLQFARAAGRSREVAVRAALGAGRGRVVRQLVTESVLLSLAGAALGLPVAAWGLDLIRAGMPAEVEKFIIGWREIQLDSRALAFTFSAAVLSGILAGLAPALQASRPNLVEALKEGSRGSSSGRGKYRLRGLLVGAEVALAVVLLVGATLMVRGFHALVNQSTSFEPATMLTLRLSITAGRYPQPHQQAAFYRGVLDRVAALPGVRSAMAVTAMPYSDHYSGRWFTIEGQPPEPGNQPEGMYQAVSPNYFATLHIALRAGRLLSPQDGPDTLRVAVISRRMAEMWWPGEPLPVGKRFKAGKPDSDAPWMTIVGVVDDVPHGIYDRTPRETVYVPFVQAPRADMDIGVRAAGDPLPLAPAVTAAIRSVDREQPVSDIATMEILRHREALGLNYVAVMMAVFGVLALVLAAVGVYGVASYLVTGQTHEIGIRMALGAPRNGVLAMVFRRGLLSTAAGLAVGLALSYELARLMASLIFGIQANDPGTFAGIPLALLAIAAVAVYVPARRATRVDPVIALRDE